MIKISTSHYEDCCEDCGYYESIVWVIEKDKKEIATLYYDGHLGSGNADLIDPERSVEAVLKALGYKVKFTDES